MKRKSLFFMLGLDREAVRLLAAVACGTGTAFLIHSAQADAVLLIAVLPMLVALAVASWLEKGRSSVSSERMSGAYATPNQCHSALSAAGVGALLWDVESNELNCTEDVSKILGRTKAQAPLTAEGLVDAVHPEDREVFSLAVEWVKNGKRRSPIDCRFIKPGGGVVWVELTLCLVEGDGDQPRIVGAMTDVTERKQVEGQLDRGVALLEAILENTKNIVFSIDSDYRLTVLNSRFLANFRAAFGKRLHVGENLMEVAPDAVTRNWKPRFERVLGGESFGLEEIFEVKGRRYYFNVSLKPIREHGRVTGATVYGRNITKQKTQERDWIEAKEQAEESDRLKSAFLANMSHEIRTPLNAVMGFAQLLKTGGGSSEEREKFVDIILSNGNHLLRILGDIIELAKIESNQLRVEPVVFDLKMSLSEIYSAFHERLRSGGEHPIELVVEGDIRGEDLILCDETRLKQIIYNLVSNAAKFTSEGSIHLGYERKEDDMVEFYVADTGEGVSAEMKQRVFKRFRQGEVRDGRRNDGVGLGLSICEGLVALLGGKIWLEDNQPCGSVFRFSVKDLSGGAALTAESPTSDQRLKAGTEDAPRTRSGSKVLVAEDDDMNFQVMNEFLKSEGLQPVRAENGEEAIAAVEDDGDIKLVVMDISMPVLNGLEATKRIKALRPELPIIAHTAHAMKSDLDRALDAGCSDCLVKPIRIDQFKQLLARYV